MMKNYSYDTNERNRKIDKILHKARVFHLKHENVAVLVLSFIFSYYLVKTGLIHVVVGFMGQFGYLSALILGFLFSFGFTTTPASVTMFFLAKTINPFLMALIGAAGAAVSNIIIYSLVKHGLLEEIRYILSEELKIEFSKFEITLNQNMMKRGWMKIVIPAIAGMLTALPIPTELLAALLWNIVRYRPQIVMIYSFFFSFIGILAIGLFGVVH
ncbi:MAG: hypothetical protein HYW23_01750 [Candidatus Aenigmarchaeota archaeon]|nr:hypothetical protein [Candidatus Aenigmarchaeota archaeon]